MKQRFFLSVCMIMLIISSFFFLMACSEEKSEQKLVPDRDVAETLAGAISYNTGGAIDQISDLCEFLDVNDTTKVEQVILKNFSPKSVSINRTYDSLNGFWTINVEKIRGDSLSAPFAHILRKYTLQFLNVNNIPQRNYVTAADTARTVLFSIKRGYGKHLTRRISQQLDSLSGAWTVTNAHLPEVTINGTYYRAATDTIRGFNRLRNSDHQLELNFNNIVAPRGVHPNIYQAVSGSLSGTFDAVITFISGTAYNETVIHRDFNVIFGDGNGSIILGSKHYWANLYSGELQD